MLELSRTVRFALTPEPAAQAPARSNTFSAWPPVRGLGRYYELHVTCRGEADPATGYFINIKHIDTAVRDHALPVLRAAIADERAAADTPMGGLMRDLLAVLQPELGHSVARLGLQLSPFVELAVRVPDPQLHNASSGNPGNPGSPGDHPVDHVIVKQQYEFSAAHRLHVPDYTEEQNRATFGKCNNPAGHGHNYRVEVAVRAPIDPMGHTLDIAALDDAVDTHVIDRLDHKHLNHDVPAFAELNPSVEHIVRVVWDMLEAGLAQVLPSVTLDEVKVWETGKTACAYRGPAVNA
ncbi:MAG: 6-carboxytetrahydropterin synthase [Planctomycetota bacterium]